MSRAARLAIALCTLGALSACDADQPEDLPSCPCDAGGCSELACDIRVRVHADCGGEFAEAEVLVGDHVELDLATPGGELSTCARIEPGNVADVWVVGGPWRWGPETVTCDHPGGSLHTLTFQCVEAPE